MPPTNFSETTRVLSFEAEYDGATQYGLDPLFLPKDEMSQDEDNVNTMLKPSNPLSADSHSDELQPNPLPADVRESGNAGERPMRVRAYNRPISYSINEICRVCQRELVRQGKLIKIHSDFRLIQTWNQPHPDSSINSV